MTQEPRTADGQQDAGAVALQKIAEAAARRGIHTLREGQSGLPEDLDRVYQSLGRAMLAAQVTRDRLAILCNDRPLLAALDAIQIEATNEFQNLTVGLCRALSILNGDPVQWGRLHVQSQTELMAEMLDTWRSSNWRDGFDLWCEACRPTDPGLSAREDHLPCEQLKDEGFLPNSLRRVLGELRRVVVGRGATAANETEAGNAPPKKRSRTRKVSEKLLRRIRRVMKPGIGQTPDWVANRIGRHLDYTRKGLHHMHKITKELSHSYGTYTMLPANTKVATLSGSR